MTGESCPITTVIQMNKNLGILDLLEFIKEEQSNV